MVTKVPADMLDFEPATKGELEAVDEKADQAIDAATAAQQTANQAVNSAPQAATASEVAAAASTTKFVTPGTAKSSPFAAKAWAIISPSGSGATILASEGVASVERTTVGTYKITWSVPFASADYAVVVCISDTANDVGAHITNAGVRERAANSVVVTTGNANNTNTTDAYDFSVVAFGNQ